MKLHQLILLTTVMTSLTGTFLSSKALAQESNDPIPHYEIEIILYKNTKVPSSQEYTLPISSPTKDDQILDFSDSSSIEAAIKKQYEVVPEVSLRLAALATKITGSSRYDVLKHFAWRQPGLEQSQALPVWIKAGQHFSNEFISIDDKIELMKASQTVDDQLTLSLMDSEKNDLGHIDITDDLATLTSIDSEQNDLDHFDTIDETALILEPQIDGLYEVEGKITVSLSRYLHVYTDLVLRKPRNPLDPQLETTNLDSQPLANKSLTEARILDNYGLKEHRRMRSETLHYLDSPEFSMLILITPYEIPLKLTGVILQTKDLATELPVIE
jgi:hypothetical protein